jgi:hypothetical protein
LLELHLGGHCSLREPKRTSTSGRSTVDTGTEVFKRQNSELINKPYATLVYIAQVETIIAQK